MKGEEIRVVFDCTHYFQAEELIKQEMLVMLRHDLVYHTPDGASISKSTLNKVKSEMEGTKPEAFDEEELKKVPPMSECPSFMSECQLFHARVSVISCQLFHARVSVISCQSVSYFMSECQLFHVRLSVISCQCPSPMSECQMSECQLFHARVSIISCQSVSYFRPFPLVTRA